MSDSRRSIDARAGRDPTGQRILLAASATLLVAAGLHGLDHVLQERGLGPLTTEFLMTAGLDGALVVLAFVVVLVEHPRAPLVAAVVGTYTAFLVTALHFVPHWSAVSDPYSELSLSALSWVAAGIEVAAAVVLAVVGVAVRQRRRTTGRLAVG